MLQRSGKLFKQFLRRDGAFSQTGAFHRRQLARRCGRCGAGGFSAAGICQRRRRPRVMQAFTKLIRPPLKRRGSRRFQCWARWPWLTAAGCNERCICPGAGLYFLARDMYLDAHGLRPSYPEEETRYLQVSRREGLATRVSGAGDWTSVLPRALPRQQLTGAQIADHWGTACPMS